MNRHTVSKTRQKIKKLLTLRQLDKALRFAEKTVQKHSNSIDAYLILGNLYTKLDKTTQATTLYLNGINRFPESGAILHNLGQSLYTQGNLTEAERYLSKAIETEVVTPQMFCNLASVQSSSGNDNAANKTLERCIKTNPDHMQVYYQKANICLRANDFNHAVDLYRKTLTLDAQHFGASFNLALALHKNEEFLSAIEAYKLCVKINPNHIDTYINLCNLLLRFGEDSTALDYSNKAYSISKYSVATLLNLVVTHKELGEIDEALSYCKRALEIAPGDSGVHDYLSDLLLLTEDFKTGWNEYEWRLHKPEVVARDFGFKPWGGKLEQGQTMLVYAEQGVGDEIMFLSCIPDLLSSGMDVVIDCDPRLEPIVSRSFPQAIVHGGTKEEPSDWTKVYPQITTECTLGSLPKHLRQSINAFPSHKSYLIANPDLKSLWSEKLSLLETPLKIGISWVAGRTAETRKKRSIELRKWHNILDTGHCTFINIQYGDHLDEIEQANQVLSTKIINYPQIKPLIELENLTALISRLDLIISVDNSTAHLAGALGVPTWVLLPYSAEWRWGIKRSNSAWYQSLKIFRQSKRNSWVDVMKSVEHELESHVNQIKRSFSS